jgi:branched-chain amino acid transport system substrate-binding protein
MSVSSFAQKIALKGAMPRISVDMRESINIGFLAPLTGPVQSWGQPGLNGCRIWEDWLNKAGGLLIGGRRYPIKIHTFDCGYDQDRALEVAQYLINTFDIKLLMMLGGDTFNQLGEYLTEKTILTTTLLPSDLSPDTPYLIAPSELHPIYVVTGVDWLARAHSNLKTVAMCGQMDAMGLPSIATYRAAFKASEIKIVKEIQYATSGADAAEIVQPMLDQNPDILCWCTSYTPMVHAMTEYAYAQGYQGKILSCTLDNYQRLVEKTSIEFMEGVTFQFPDFDDPMLNKKTFFFNQPHAFYKEYNKRFPDNWTAVSWEYAAGLDIWHAAVEKAGSVNSVSVMAAMKQLGEVTHAFGPAKWWGEEIFGTNNALVGEWPVVTIQNGKAKIVEFGSIPDWLDQYGDSLKQEMQNLGQLWDQRLASCRQKSEIL